MKKRSVARPIARTIAQSIVRHVIPGLICIIGTAAFLSSCSSDSSKSGQMDATPTTVAAISPDSSATTAAASEPANGSSTTATTATTATLTPTPAAQYVFDLSGETAAPEGNGLAMYLQKNAAVILSRDNPPHFIKGNFDWTYPNLWSGTDTTEASWTRLWNEHQNTEELFYSGVTPVQYSMDSTSLAFLRNRTANKTYELMYFGGTKEIHVADQVFIYVMSDDGSTIAYLIRSSKAGEKDTLYTYDCSSGVSTKVAEDAGTYFTLSPTGKVIAYEALNGDTKSSYYSINKGAPQLIGTGYSIIAITDDASTAYYLKYGGKNPEFGAMHNGTFLTYFVGSYADFANFESGDLGFSARPIFNKDHSQVLYSNKNATYFAMNGQAGVSVFDTSYIEAVGYQNRYDDSEIYTRVAYCTKNMFCYSKFLDSKNLCNVLFILNYDKKTNVAFFNEKMETRVNESSSYANGFTSGKGNGFLLESYNEQTQLDGLEYLPDYLTSLTGETVLDKYVWSYELTSNQTIYYSNDIGQLYELRNGVKTKIDTYASVIDSVDIKGVTYVYYFRDMDEYGKSTLCCIKDLPGAKPVVIDKNVERTYTCSAGLLYYKNSVYFDAASEKRDLYAGTNGTDYAFVMTQEFNGAA